MIRVFLASLFITFASLPAMAQSTVWVQIEAQPTLSQAQGRARAYAGQLDDVSGYFLGGRWYAVVLGPYARGDAEAVLRQLRASGQIAADSFVTDGARFRQQFYPIGVGAQTAARPLPEGIVAAPAAQAVATGTPDHEHPVEPEELMREEAGVDGLLNGSERRALQSALRFAGVYDGPVDGMIGRATRAAIRTWQQARGEEPNGALNISQREALLAAYEAARDGIVVQLVRADVAGIEMLIPTQMVAFGSYEPPFVHFGPVGDSGTRVMLISQAGDAKSLAQLYQMMQSLSVVPRNGPRSLGEDAFEIEGISADIRAYTYARLEDGAIKGFSLILPAADAQSQRLILDQMRASFTTFDAVMPDTLDQ